MAPKKKSSKTNKKKRVANPVTNANLIPIEPNQVLNPNGAKPLTELERSARTLARREIAEIFPRLINMTAEEIQALNYKKLPANEAIFVRKIQNDLRTGSTDELHRMYDRLLGKPHITATIENNDLAGTTISIDILSNDESEDEFSDSIPTPAFVE